MLDIDITTTTIHITPDLLKKTQTITPTPTKNPRKSQTKSNILIQISDSHNLHTFEIKSQTKHM